jgi:hypothetical protein
MEYPKLILITFCITSLYLKGNTESYQNQLGILHEFKVFCLNKREKME